MVGSTIWSIFIARYVKHGICRRRVSAGFVLTIASRGPSAIAEVLVKYCGGDITMDVPLHKYWGDRSNRDRRS